MKKIIPVLFFILSIQVLSQQKHPQKSGPGEPSFQKLIYTQTLILPGDSVKTFYYMFILPYQNIIFLKNGEDYKAEIRIDVEVTDLNSNFVTREIKNWKFICSSFEQTVSPEIYAEGLVGLKLPEGDYFVQPIITDHNSGKETKLKKEKIKVENDSKIDPLIVDSKKIICSDEEFFKLTNFEGNIPFAPMICDIIIPVQDISLNEVSISVLSRNDTIITKTLNDYFISSVNLIECSGNIVVSENKNLVTKNFLLKGISGKLKEGPFSIIIREDDDKERRFNSSVFWYNKPRSLLIPEFGIRALKYIDKESLIDSLLSINDEDMYNSLVDYWKKMDPSPETEFNELMAQYYSRVDYAQSNFSSITGTKGVDTDRGKIYIKFGKPDEVERTSNHQGKVVETWIYTKLERKFVFVDKQGVGEFSLESS